MGYSIDVSPGRIVGINGEEFLYFGGTSYLGLQSDESFVSLLARNIHRYGSSHGASRWSNLRLSIYEEVEYFLAAWAGSEAALTVSSGFLAGQLVSAYFDNDSYQAFYAPNAHAALIRGRHKPYPDFDSLGAALKKHLAKKDAKIPVLFMDSLDLNGQAYPHFNPLKKLPLQDMVLVADDSHAFGIFGEGGCGTYNTLQKLGPKELVVCASLGKALAVQGGVIFCTSPARKEFWGTAFFAGASPAPPAHMATLMAAKELYRSKKLQLDANTTYLFKKWTQRLGYAHTHGYPVIGFDNSKLTARLEQEKILVTEFPYPTSQSKSLPGRIVISAHHLEQDINRLTTILNTFSRDN